MVMPSMFNDYTLSADFTPSSLQWRLPYAFHLGFIQFIHPIDHAFSESLTAFCHRV